MFSIYRSSNNIHSYTLQCGWSVLLKNTVDLNHKLRNPLNHLCCCHTIGCADFFLRLLYISLFIFLYFPLMVLLLNAHNALVNLIWLHKIRLSNLNDNESASVYFKLPLAKVLDVHIKGARWAEQKPAVVLWPLLGALGASAVVYGQAAI